MPEFPLNFSEMTQDKHSLMYRSVPHMTLIMFNKSKFLIIVMPLHIAGVPTKKLQKKIHFSRDIFPDFGVTVNNNANNLSNTVIITLYILYHQNLTIALC